MGISAGTNYAAEVLRPTRESRMYCEEDRLFSRFLLGRLYGWKAKPNYILCHRGQWRQTYEWLTDISAKLAEPQRGLRASVVVRSIQRPSFTFRPEAVDNAFGEGAWEALNDAIAII